MKPVHIGLLVLAALLLPVVVNAGETEAPDVSQVELASGGGLVIDRPKWHKFGPTSNIGLLVTFTWGGKPARVVEGQDGGSHWRVVFPDRPEREELATLRFSYLFNVTDEQRAELREKVEDVYAALAKVLLESAEAIATDPPPKEPKEALGKEFSQRSDGVAAALTPLESYRKRKGESAAEILLGKLKLKRDDDGAFLLSDETLDQLILYSQTFLTRIGSAERMLSELEKQVEPWGREGDCPKPDDCRCAVRAAIESKEPSWTAVAQTCGTQYCAAAPSDQKGACQAKVDGAVAAMKNPEPKSLDDAFQEDKGADRFSLAETDKSLSAVRTAYQYARYKQIVPQARSFALTKLNELRIMDIGAAVEVYAVDLKADMLATELLDMDRERRWFDTSTGVVWTGDIRDFVVPLYLAFCPFDGCLRKGEKFWDSGAFWHSVSIDVGIPTAILDTPDRRHDGSLGFLVGASWNPFYIVRLSVGYYVYENELTTNPNHTWYAGVTINLIHASELFGVFGWGTPEPKVKKAGE